MTDKEFIELAAKAAGVKLQWHHSGAMAFSGWQRGKFDPLNDDGDALRLAVNLGLTINVNGMFVHADCCNRDDDIGYFEENSARNDGCILKAARRVIVRAAAAIGEDME